VRAGLRVKAYEGKILDPNGLRIVAAREWLVQIDFECYDEMRKE
jgi:hypothetical protein